MTGPAENPAAEPAPPAHPTRGLDDIVHQRHRLGVLTITAEARKADFGHLRQALGLTAGNLSRHLSVLEEAGLVQVEKGYEGRRPRTWVTITGRGRKALAAELTALAVLARRHAAHASDGSGNVLPMEDGDGSAAPAASPASEEAGEADEQDAGRAR